MTPPCRLFARTPDDGGVRWTREQLEWVGASDDPEVRAHRVQVLAAVLCVVVDQTWGAAVVDSDGAEYMLAVSWDREPFASLDPDELELLCAQWLCAEGWRPEHGGDAALAAMQHAEERHAPEGP